MEMTEGEIVKSYNKAKNKKYQLQILAELNACDTTCIMEIIDQNKSKKLPKESVSEIRQWFAEQMEATDLQIRALEKEYKKYAVTYEMLGRYEELNKNEDRKDVEKR